MSLIIGKWDEKYYEIRPKIPDEEKKINQNKLYYLFDIYLNLIL